MHAGMASGLKRRFDDDDDDDDDLSHITLRSMSKYRLVMTSMIWMTLEMTGLTNMHHAPSFAALTLVVHLPTSKIIAVANSHYFPVDAARLLVIGPHNRRRQIATNDFII